MSRLYDMSVEISGHRPDRLDAIKEAAEQEWPFDGLVRARRSLLTASGEEKVLAAARRGSNLPSGFRWPFGGPRRVLRGDGQRHLPGGLALREPLASISPTTSG